MYKVTLLNTTVLNDENFTLALINNIRMEHEKCPIRGEKSYTSWHKIVVK